MMAGWLAGWLAGCNDVRVNFSIDERKRKKIVVSLYDDSVDRYLLLCLSLSLCSSAYHTNGGDDEKENSKQQQEHRVLVG